MLSVKAALKLRHGVRLPNFIHRFRSSYAVGRVIGALFTFILSAKHAFTLHNLNENEHVQHKKLVLTLHVVILCDKVS